MWTKNRARFLDQSECFGAHAYSDIAKVPELYFPQRIRITTSKVEFRVDINMLT